MKQLKTKKTDREVLQGQVEEGGLGGHRLGQRQLFRLLLPGRLLRLLLALARVVGLSRRRLLLLHGLVQVQLANVGRHLDALLAGVELAQLDQVGQLLAALLVQAAQLLVRLAGLGQPLVDASEGSIIENDTSEG